MPDGTPCAIRARLGRAWVEDDFGTLRAKNVAPKWTIVVAADLEAEPHAQRIGRYGWCRVGLVVVGLPESGLVRNVDLRIGVQARAVRSEEQGRIVTGAGRILHDRAAEQTNPDVCGKFGLHAVTRSTRRLCILGSGDPGRRHPGQNRQFREHGEVRPGGFGLEQAVTKSLSAGVVVKDVPDQCDGQCGSHGRSVLAEAASDGRGCRRGMAESRRHLRLKRAAAGWLRAAGFVAVAEEVTIPAGGFRADVAGWTDRCATRCGPRVRCAPRTCMIECKVSRADFARDGGHAARLLGRQAAIRQALAGVRGGGRRMVNRSGPMLIDLRGSCLDAETARLRRLELELIAIDRRLAGRCKFAKMAWWGLADELWLAAPEGLVQRRSLPRGWGLLEADRDDILRVAIPAGDGDSSDQNRFRVLRGIACAGSRRAGQTQLPLQGVCLSG